MASRKRTMVAGAADENKSTPARSSYQPREMIHFYSRRHPTDTFCSPITAQEIQGMRERKAGSMSPIAYPYASREQCEKQFTIDRSVIGGSSDIPDDLQLIMEGYLDSLAEGSVLPAVQQETLQLADLYAAIDLDLEKHEYNPDLPLIVPQLIRMGFANNRFQKIVENLNYSPPSMVRQYVEAMATYPDILADLPVDSRLKLFNPLANLSDDFDDFIVATLYPLKLSDILVSDTLEPGEYRSILWQKMLEKFIRLYQAEAETEPEAVSELTRPFFYKLDDMIQSKVCNANFSFAPFGMLPLDEKERKAYEAHLRANEMVKLFNLPSVAMSPAEIKEKSQRLTELLIADNQDPDRCLKRVGWKSTPQSFDLIVKVVAENFDRLGGFNGNIIKSLTAWAINSRNDTIINLLLSKANPIQRANIIGSLNFLDRNIILTPQEMEIVRNSRRNYLDRR
jgi:hypothetical protein